MADFYAARDNTTPPLPWPSIAPPFTVGGGAGGTVRIFEVLIGGDGIAGAPEWEIEMDIGAIAVDDLVTVTLGFDPLLNRPAVSLRHDPQTAPGLF